jgi:exosortase
MSISESKSGERLDGAIPPAGHELPTAGATNRLRTRGPLLLVLLPLLYLWWVLVRQLSIAWSNNPQYAYGWSVPFLCLYLIWRRAESRKQSGEKQKSGEQKAEIEPQQSEVSGQWSVLYLLFALCALLYAPIRLFQEANPGWSLVSWALAGVVIGLTLLAVHLLLGASAPRTSDFGLRTSSFAFPICFFLVAVPWPYVLENPIIQALTRLNAGLTIEMLGGLGTPAVQHGNLIELATGTVGIDEACSGIRSLQATLMVSLFLGELYRLGAMRRLVCVIAGFALAMLCNLARMLLLCWVASQRGIEAIASWHDPGGVSILVACFIGVWFCAWRLRAGNDKHAPPLAKSAGRPRTLVDLAAAVSPHRVSFGVLGIWLVLVEFSVAGWYRHIECHLPAQPSWSIDWPVHANGYREVPVPHEAAAMLRYDEVKQAQWTFADGTRWQFSWFHWNPGTAAGYLAKSHNPLICMPAAGYQVISVSPVEFVDVGGLRMPVRVYHFAEGGNSVHVLYSRWEDQAFEQSFGSEGVTRFNRLRSVWNGRGNQGQRVISLALWTGENAQGAREQLIRQLQSLLVVNPLR